MFQKTYFSLQRQNEKHLRLNEAKEFWKKNSEKIWRQEKMTYFCSPKFRE